MQKSINWPSRINKYPKTLERFRATCIFFDVKFPPFLAGNINSKTWVSWGALTALASIHEIFTIEIETLGYYEACSTLNHKSLFFRKVCFSDISQLNNVKNGKSYMNQGGLAKFNEIVEKNTVEDIVDMALDILSEQICIFSSKINIHD